MAKFPVELYAPATLIPECQPQIVYVLVAEGVSIAGIIGVYRTEAAAREAAELVLPQTDGYHDFVIYPRDMNADPMLAFPTGSPPPRPGANPAIEVKEC